LVLTLNKITRISLSITLIASLLVVTPSVFAAATTPNQSKDQPKTTSSESKAQLTTAKKTITDRIAMYKLEHAITLGAAEQIKIKTVCKAGQLKVKALDVRVTTHSELRNDAYKEITTILTNVVPRIKKAGVDTTALSASQTQLNTLIATYKTNLKTYQTSLSDLGELECQTDPAAFKSALEAARANRVEMTTNALAIRSYVTDVIKPALQTVRTEIEKPAVISTTEAQ